MNIFIQLRNVGLSLAAAWFLWPFLFLFLLIMIASAWVVLMAAWPVLIPCGIIYLICKSAKKGRKVSA